MGQEEALGREKVNPRREKKSLKSDHLVGRRELLRFTEGSKIVCKYMYLFT